MTEIILNITPKHLRKAVRIQNNSPLNSATENSERIVTSDKNAHFTSQEYIPLTNRIQGPYCKLRILVFSPSMYGLRASRLGHKSKGKKRRSVTYSTHRENKVRRYLILYLYYVSDGLRNNFYSHGTTSNL